MPVEKSIRVELFDLEHTLTSGQVFRCRRTGDGWTVCARDRMFTVRQTADRLHFAGVDKQFIRRFLGLDHDLRSTLRRLAKFPQLRPALRACEGMRIVRHDPWEALVSFICSANSNIPKIARSLEMMSKLLGRPISCGEHHWHAFPEPGTLADAAVLRKTGIGYRAEYLAATNNACPPGMLEQLAQMPYVEAREQLKRLPGVGDKVADCVCLFGLGFGQAFPVDVWVMRAMRELFPQAGTTERDIRRAAAETFGGDAGYAQQYLFHYQRSTNRRAAG